MVSDYVTVPLLRRTRRAVVRVTSIRKFCRLEMKTTQSPVVSHAGSQ